MTLKERARAYYTAVNNYDAETIERMVDEGYIQHNPRVPTGRAAFLSFLPRLKKHGSKIKNIRMLEDGRYVVMHHQWRNAQPFGHDVMAAFHIIRFDDRTLIAEHWNVNTKDSLEPSITDGPTRIEDFHLTEENRALMARLLPTLESTDFTYQKLHKVFGEGSFALAISEAMDRGVHSAVYDLCLLQNQRMTRHWRIAQAVPTENLANNNTMFGF